MVKGGCRSVAVDGTGVSFNGEGKAGAAEAAASSAMATIDVATTASRRLIGARWRRQKARQGSLVFLCPKQLEMLSIDLSIMVRSSLW